MMLLDNSSEIWSTSWSLDAKGLGSSTTQVSFVMDVDPNMEQCQYVWIRLLGQTTHQNLNISLETNLTSDATRNSCLSQNFLLLQLF